MNASQTKGSILVRRFLFVLALLPLCAAAGPARKTARAAAKPSVRITRIPPAGAGPEQMATIAGQVSGVDVQKCKVVVFAGTDKWYAQPYVGASDTSIGAAGKWETDTHLGSEYAVLLVKNSYRAPATTAELPRQGGEVLAIARVRASR